MLSESADFTKASKLSVPILHCIVFFVLASPFWWLCWRQVNLLIQSQESTSLQGNSSISLQESTETHFMVPYMQNKLFIGKKESREEFDRAFGPDEGHRRLGVWGLGGIG